MSSLINKPFRKYDIEPQTLFYNIYYLLFDEYIYLKSYKVGEILNSKISYDYLNGKQFTLNLKNTDEYDFLLPFMRSRTLLFERVYYNEPDVNLGEFNELFYIYNLKVVAQQQNQQLEQNLEISGYDFSLFYEKRKIVEHNVFYDTLPAEEPDDFNKINFYNKTPLFIFQNIYDRNILNPVERVKAKTPSNNGGERIILGLNLIIYDYNMSDLPNYSTLRDKLSIFDFKVNYLNYSLENVGKVFIQKSKINANNYVDLHIREPINVIIDNLNSKDVPISYKFEESYGDYINAPNVQSSGFDFYQYSHSPTVDTSFSSSFELIDEISVDGEEDPIDVSNRLISRSDEILYERKRKQITAFEIEFKEREFIKQLYVGDTLTLVNFGVFDGTYLIKKITEILEDEYISYIIDEMEEITINAMEGNNE